MKNLLILLVFAMLGCSHSNYVGKIHGKGIARVDGNVKMTCAVLEGPLWNVEQYTSKKKNCWCFIDPTPSINKHLNVVFVLAAPKMCTMQDVSAPKKKVKTNYRL